MSVQEGLVLNTICVSTTMASYTYTVGTAERYIAPTHGAGFVYTGCHNCGNAGLKFLYEDYFPSLGISSCSNTTEKFIVLALTSPTATSEPKLFRLGIKYLEKLESERKVIANVFHRDLRKQLLTFRYETRTRVDYRRPPDVRERKRRF